jgi:hypothetical protein
VPVQGTVVKVMLPYTNVAQPEPNRKEVFSIEVLKTESTEKKSLTRVYKGKK